MNSINKNIPRYNALFHRTNAHPIFQPRFMSVLTPVLFRAIHHIVWIMIFTLSKVVRGARIFSREIWLPPLYFAPLISYFAPLKTIYARFPNRLKLGALWHFISMFWTFQPDFPSSFIPPSTLMSRFGPHGWLANFLTSKHSDVLHCSLRLAVMTRFQRLCSFDITSYQVINTVCAVYGDDRYHLPTWY